MQRVAWAALLVVSLTEAAAAEDLALRGFVRDAATRAPVAGATVSVSGAQSRADQLTDDAGFFRLVLPEAAPGSLVRLHVQKTGYDVYDRNLGASAELPVDVALSVVAVRPPSRQEPGEMKRLLRGMRSGSVDDRLAVIGAIRDRGVPDSTAERILALALSDADWDVRMRGMYAVVALRAVTPTLIGRIVPWLHHSERIVVNRTCSALAQLAMVAERGSTQLFNALAGGECEGRGDVDAALLKLAIAADRRDVPAIVDRLLARAVPAYEAHDTLRALFQRRPDLASPRVAGLIARLELEDTADVHRGSSKAPAQNLISLLSCMGSAGRAALVRHAAQLPPGTRTPFILLWSSVEHAVYSDIAVAFSPADISASLSPLLADQKPLSYDFWPGGRRMQAGDILHRSDLASAALLILGVEPIDNALTSFGGALRTSADARVFFALQVIPLFSGSMAQRALALATEILSECRAKADCFSQVLRGRDDARKEFSNLLAQRADASAVPALERIVSDLEAETRLRQLARDASAAIRTRFEPDHASK